MSWRSHRLGLNAAQIQIETQIGNNVYRLRCVGVGASLALGRGARLSFAQSKIKIQALRGFRLTA